MKTKKISIIIPTYNSADTLQRSIASISEQQVAGVEIIVIDGKSTDSTLEVIKRNQSLLSYYISEPDKGVYDAIRKGIEASSGFWIYVLGSDDQMLPSLSNVSKYLIDKNAIYYGNVILSSNGGRYDGKFSKLKLLTKNIPHQAIFYPRRVFDVHNYDLSYRMLADYAFNLTCINDSRFCFKYINESIAIYNNTSGISSTIVDVKFKQDKMSIIKKNYPSHIYNFYRFCLFLKNLMRIDVKY